MPAINEGEDLKGYAGRLAIMAHGVDWVNEILKIPSTESKLAEIYEQGFAIMMMEHGITPREDVD